MDDRLKLLIVDDDEVDRVAVRRALHASGIAAEVDEVADAAAVTAQLARKTYDCLIVDHSLPGEDGLSLVKRLRAAGNDTPILAVTGHEEEIGARLVAAGASDYLPKSDLESGRLARRLRYAIRVGRAESEAAAERQLLESILRQMPAAVLICDVASGQVLLANEQLDELLGQPVARRDTVAQLRRIAAFHPDERALRDDEWPIVRALAGETVNNEELHIARADGTRIVVRASAAPVFAPGRPARVAVMTLDDITAERQARDEVERAARAREEILAVVSHDLRNPLNAVSVAVDELATPDLEPDARTRYAAAIRRAVGRADRLIRDLLDASRIEAGKLGVELQSVDARGLLEQAARDHEVLARDAGMAVEVRVVGEVGRVRADRDRLLQALGNLIGNAMRYARGAGPIELIAGNGAAGVELRVCDRGPGIEPAALAHIFDRYWQANRQRRAGAGLGLAIAKGIAEAHGGTLLAENRDGGGASFCLTLPAGG